MIQFPKEITPTQKTIDFIFSTFEPKHPPAGLTFANDYKPFVKKGFLNSEYFVVVMTHGDMDDGESYICGQWCDRFYQFKSREDMNQALATFAYIKQEKDKKNDSVSRNSVFKENKELWTARDLIPFLKKAQKSFIFETV